MFRAVDVVVVNKIDLLPHLDVDLECILDNVRAVNPQARVILASARTGQGVDEWCGWLTSTERLRRLAQARGDCADRCGVDTDEASCAAAGVGRAPNIVARVVIQVGQGAEYISSITSAQRAATTLRLTLSVGVSSPPPS